MMKKTAILLMCSLLLTNLCGCAAIRNMVSADATEEISEETAGEEDVIEPELSQIRNICNLAALECYYHNVAKSVKEAGTGILHWGEEERTFWIEYTGVAKIGIDLSDVSMSVDGTTITITLPDAQLISCEVDSDSITESSYIYSQDSFFNKNPITADDQTAAVEAAQEQMKAEIEANSSLLLSAQERAKTLIENYITQLSDAAGVSYTIEWVYPESGSDD